MALRNIRAPVARGGERNEFRGLTEEEATTIGVEIGRIRQEIFGECASEAMMLLLRRVATSTRCALSIHKLRPTRLQLGRDRSGLPT